MSTRHRVLRPWQAVTDTGTQASAPADTTTGTAGTPPARPVTAARETPATPRRDTVASRRIRVRHLADQGKSLREIAAELGVSKDTVSRDLAALRRSETADATDRTPDATPDSESATDETPRLTIPVSRRMADDLAVLADAGLSEHAAVEAAIGLLSNTYRWAWLRGLTPRRVRPTISRVVIEPHGGPHGR